MLACLLGFRPILSYALAHCMELILLPDYISLVAAWYLPPLVLGETIGIGVGPIHSIYQAP